MRKAMKIFIGVQVVGGLGLAAYLKYQEVKNEDEEKNKMKAEIKRLMKEMVNLRKTYIINIPRFNMEQRKETINTIFNEELDLANKIYEIVDNSKYNFKDFNIDIDMIEAELDFFRNERKKYAKYTKYTK